MPPLTAYVAGYSGIGGDTKFAAGFALGPSTIKGIHEASAAVAVLLSL